VSAPDLADLLRMGRLPEAWIAPPAVRSQRELVRHRHKLRQLCSGIKSGAHAVLAKNRLCIPRSDVFGLDGRRRLAELALPEAFRIHLDSQLRVVDLPEAEIDTMDARIAALFTEHDQAYRAVLRVPGIGPVFAAVFRAEIGEVTGFPSPRQINSMGRADPSPPRVRHHCPSRTDHETGLAAGALGRGRGRPTQPGRHRCAAPTNKSSPGAVPGQAPGQGRRRA
jgi:transposase